MKKIFCLVFTLLLFGTVLNAVAGSGRESTMLPPQEVKIMYSSEDHGYQQKDISGAVRWKTYPDGSMAINNSSGQTIFAVDPTGKFGSSVGFNSAIIGGTTATVIFGASTVASTGSGAGSSGWYLTAAHLRDYNQFFVETGAVNGGSSTYSLTPVGGGQVGANSYDGVGATIYLTGLLSTASNINGKVFSFTNISETTPFFLFDGNGRFNGTTGTTEVPRGIGTAVTTGNYVPDARGDTIEIMAVTSPTAVSGWYVRRIWAK